ncbi:zinc finger protein 184-like isoform X3 [Lytechinus pictus]|uniref:zinc finger protein 184-like isoform X3 n=1 Tax=Lytechinus pictus TaxID=7653 RepID=UPI0030B9EC09
MSVPESEDAFSDVKPYFTPEEWTKISNYERICIKNVKENYEIMLKAGLQACLPMFMQRENEIMDSGWIQIKEEIKNEEEESDIKSEEGSLDVLVENQEIQEQDQTEEQPSYEESFQPHTIKIEALSDDDDDYFLNDLHSGEEWNSDILKLKDLGKAIQSQSSLSDQENQSGDLNTQSCDQKSEQSSAEVAAGGNQTPKRSGDLNTQSCDQKSEQSSAEVAAGGNQTPKQSGDLNTQSCDQKSEQSSAEVAAGGNQTPKQSGDLNTQSCDQKSEQSSAEVAAGGNQTPKQSGDLNTQSCDQKSEQSLAEVAAGGNQTPKRSGDLNTQSCDLNTQSCDLNTQSHDLSNQSCAQKSDQALTEIAPGSLISKESRDLNNQSCDLNSLSGDPDIQSCDQSSEQTLTKVGPASNQIPEKPQSCLEVGGQFDGQADRKSHSLLGADELSDIPFSTKEEPEADQAEHDTGNDDDPEKLWCICRQPYDEKFMICCDKCEDWFHGKCVNVKKKEGKRMERENISWMCPKCTDSGIYRCKYCGSLYAIPLVLARHLKYKHGLSGVFLSGDGSRGDNSKYSGPMNETSDNINEHLADGNRTFKSENHIMPQITSFEFSYLVRRNCRVDKSYECNARSDACAGHIQNQENTGETNFVCDHCDEAFTNRRALKGHQRIHADGMPYACDQCGKVFNYPIHLAKHKRIHTGYRTYECDQCIRVFKKGGDFKVHYKIHTREKPYACEQCGKVFITKNYLERHIKQIHNDEKSYECDQCGKAFNQQGKLTIHKQSHTGEKPYKCDQCGKTLNNKSHLEEHKRTHTGEKPYVCDVCSRAFCRKQTLTLHKRNHTSEKPCICDQCGKAFKRPTYLARHKVIHTGEKPYVCDQCGMAFKMKQYLTKHKLIHTGEKPYICDQCNKAFTEERHLVRHKLIHTDDKPYVCNQCDMAFKQKYDLTRHISTPIEARSPMFVSNTLRHSVINNPGATIAKQVSNLY